jgi:hypothetical protein
MAQHHRSFNTSTSWADRVEFLAQARLLEQAVPEESRPQTLVSYASLILFGKVASLERNARFFETVVMIGGQHFSIRKNIVDSVRELCIGESSILRTRLPWVPAEVFKELLVNAYIHRCYRTPSPVIVEIADWGVEIRSPGELLTGLTITNLIHGVPAYRNLLLADGARFAGLCDKIGQGIDLVFNGVLESGLGFPEFESANNLFVARILREGSTQFREFVKKRSQSLTQLDEIIVLRLLWRRQAVPLDELCAKMQRKREFAMHVLMEMKKKGMIEMDDVAYRLTTAVHQDIETIFQSDQLPLDPSMWGA